MPEQQPLHFEGQDRATLWMVSPRWQATIVPLPSPIDYELHRDMEKQLNIMRRKCEPLLPLLYSHIFRLAFLNIWFWCVMLCVYVCVCVVMHVMNDSPAWLQQHFNSFLFQRQIDSIFSIELKRLPAYFLATSSSRQAALSFRHAFSCFAFSYNDCVCVFVWIMCECRLRVNDLMCLPPSPFNSNILIDDCISS